MVCDMAIGPSGEIGALRVLSGGDSARTRGSPTRGVGRRSPVGQGATAERPARHLYALFKVLLAARERRGAIDFETVETRMMFDEKGKIERIVPRRATTRTG